jgi:hypothetical protein
VKGRGNMSDQVAGDESGLTMPIEWHEQVEREVDAARQQGYEQGYAEGLAAGYGRAYREQAAEVTKRWSPSWATRLGNGGAYRLFGSPEVN